MRHDRRPELPLFTARAVARIAKASDGSDSRRFCSHEDSIIKRKHRCCVQWDGRTSKWIPTKNPCSEGTHDFIALFAEVVYAHTAQPWKKAPKNPDRVKRPRILISIRANGEMARKLMMISETQPFLVQGHITRMFNFGRYWDILNAFELKLISDEQIKSQLSIIAFNSFREALGKVAKPIPYQKPISTSFVERIRQRRRDLAQGLLQQEPPAKEDA